jgi:formylglycine-generating enzyme required for sulfatase activity
VRLEAFELGKFPVTFAEWDAALAAGAILSQPDDKPNYVKRGWGRDRRPVINVSWHDTQAYIAWLNSKTSGGYRLPSEAEWEYACRAGTTTPYWTGASISKSQGQFNSQSTALVGSYPPNAFGLHDMHGNVSEWCEDVWHDNYDGAPSDGSARVSGGDASFRVLRGGNWSTSPVYLRSASRYWRYRADAGYGLFGFRVARTVQVVSV